LRFLRILDLFIDLAKINADSQIEKENTYIYDEDDIDYFVATCSIQTKYFKICILIYIYMMRYYVNVFVKLQVDSLGKSCETNVIPPINK